MYDLPVFVLIGTSLIPKGISPLSDTIQDVSDTYTLAVDTTQK